MSIKISARSTSYNRSSKRGLVGSVYRSDIERPDAYVGDYRIPIVDNNSSESPKIISGLEEGRFLIQLSLPDGRVITQNFEVKDSQKTDLIINLPHDSPHEWTTLQAMTGEFAGDKAATGSRTRSSGPQVSTRYASLKADPERGYLLSLLKPVDTPGCEIFEQGNTLARFSALIRGNDDIQSASERLGFAHPVSRASLDDDEYAMFRFGHSGLLQGEDEDPGGFYFGPGTDLERQYLLQQSRHGAQLICLPTPWMTPDGQASVELLVKTHNMAQSLDYSMTIGEPMVNSALGYINAGAIHLAQRLIDARVARDMLFSKVSYPFTATIGGYILVLGRSNEQYRSNESQWKNWVANLDRWFEWLPDGAILHATMCLMDRKPDLDNARDAIQRACKRGLPVFTFGLKYLMDGLRYFDGLQEPWAKEALQTLQPIAMRTNPGVPFLSVSYSTHWEKKQEPVLMEYAHA